MILVVIIPHSVRIAGCNLNITYIAINTVKSPETDRLLDSKKDRGNR